MKITTKAGDKGYSKLWDGKKLKKDHPLFEALGSLDELSSLLGILIVKAKKKEIKDFFISIQKDLYKIMSYIAGKKGIDLELETSIKKFEQKIEYVAIKKQKLNRFILPYGNEFVTFLHFSRAIARRAERRVVSVCENEAVLKYMNRLSDFLFALALESAEDLHLV